MGVLNQVKKIAGGALDIEIELPRRYLSNGDSVSFYVTLSSEEPINVRRVVASLVPSDSGSTPLDLENAAAAEKEISGEIVVNTAVPVHLASSIEIPELEAEQVRPESHWRLYVRADVPNGVDSIGDVGFTVAPAYHIEWRLQDPILLKIPGEYTEVRARGTCAVVQVTGIPVDTLRAVIEVMVAEALTDLLNDDLSLIRRKRGSSERQREIAGALRELVNPRIRNSVELPLDSVLDLTLDELLIKQS